MALQKVIRQDDGIVTNYHRILFIQSSINSHISIAVMSYVDEESRKSGTSEFPPYAVSTAYEIDYRENMTIKEAYKYLKTLPDFEGATDI